MDGWWVGFGGLNYGDGWMDGWILVVECFVFWEDGKVGFGWLLTNTPPFLTTPVSCLYL